MVNVTSFLHITVQYSRILMKVTIMMMMMVMMMEISNGINESFAVEAGPVQPRFNTLLLIRIIIIGIPSNPIQFSPIQQCDIFTHCHWCFGEFPCTPKSVLTNMIVYL